MNQIYELFELDITAIQPQIYQVTVVHSTAGEAQATLHLPFDAHELELRLKDLEIALLRASGIRRQVLLPEAQTIQHFGSELFDALITGEVRSRYDVSQARAQHLGLGLRIKLRIQVSELAVLPWEFLYDVRCGEFVCLSRHTPLVRYLDLPQPVPPLIVTPPLQILGIVVSPTDVQALDIGAEKKRVEDALQVVQQRGIVKLTWMTGETWRDIQRAMRSGPWHIVHFIGHGTYDRNLREGMIVLSNPQQKTQLVTATDFSRLLADHSSLRLVILNACEGARGSGQDLFSSTAATLVRRGIPAVLAMQYTISDLAALELAQTFYESLADNLPVDAAVAEARKAIALNQSLEWGTPVLYMRAADGVIFTVQPQAEAPITPPNKTPAPITKPSQPPVLFDWVPIPAGEFRMGNDRAQDLEAFDREQPSHTLFLPDYRLARFPVTVAQFARFVEATSYRTTAEEKGVAVVWSGAKWQEVAGADWAHPTGPHSNVIQKADHPVTCVSWQDALAFCAWAGVRLATEAEWEKAARGTEGLRYPWGNERLAADQANVNLVARDTSVVGSYPTGRSPFGVEEMAGNVWEWTSTLYQPYPYRHNDGREDVKADGDRVLRGGSFANSLRHARCACRLREKPTYRGNTVGFRVAISGL